MKSIARILDDDKCFKKSTEVLMFDGTVKKVEDVVVGDVLMGDDSTPREIIRLFDGEGKLYKITPHDTTEPYYVTKYHVLCMRYNTRPQLTKDNGKYPRYRIQYTESYIDDSGYYLLLKAHTQNSNFAVGKHTDNGALERAQSVLKMRTEKYEAKFPEHEVEAKSYLKQTKSFNHRLVGFRVGVEFSQYKPQTLDPYLLGAWLGDGTSTTPQITNIDPELIDYLYKEAENMGLTITRGEDTKSSKGSMKYMFISESGKRGTNPFINFLKSNNLINNKHIPHNYKINTRSNRLALLAGLIDTDGHYGNESYYEIFQKNVTLSNDIVFVARSLGFWCHIKPVIKGCMYKGEMKNGTYQKITFGGDNLHELPVKLPRKMAHMRTERMQKDALHYKFDVKEDEPGEFFGFEVSGTNERFLLSDFTVIR